MKTRVLVIEDNPANLDLMAYLFGAFGYQQISASSGGVGLDAAHREVPDLILCDIQLPDMDGHEIARQLKSHPVLRKVPLVAVTALAMIGDRDKILASGFDGYLAKPIAPETFIQQVEAFLRPDQRMTRPGTTPAEITPDPAEITPDPAEITPDPPPTTPRQGTILIVDDSPPNIAVFSSIVQSFGYSVIAAENIKDGMELAKRYHPDMIVSDIHLRTESGYDFLRAVKTVPQLCSVPFVFISSTVLRERDQAVSLALGADRFISRPLEAAGAAGRDRIRLGRARDQ